MRLMQGWNRFLRSKRATGPIRSCGDRMRAGLRGGEDGQAALELALVLPAFMFLLMGMLVFGLYFNNYLTLSNAVGQGAARLQQIRTTTTDPCADTFAAVTAAAPNLTSNQIGLVLNLNGGPNVTGTSCPSQASALANMQGDPVEVTATYPCTLVVVGVNFGSTVCPMTASSTAFEY